MRCALLVQAAGVDGLELRMAHSNEVFRSLCRFYWLMMERREAGDIDEVM
jgi:hypothetical protein